MDANMRTQPLYRPLYGLGRLWTLVAGWAERQRQRRHLAALPDHLLRDIGITPADVWQEASKPFWRG